MLTFDFDMTFLYSLLNDFDRVCFSVTCLSYFSDSDFWWFSMHVLKTLLQNLKWGTEGENGFENC